MAETGTSCNSASDALTSARHLYRAERHAEIAGTILLPTVILALFDPKPASAGLADGAQANLKAASAQFEALLKEDAARPPRPA